MPRADSAQLNIRSQFARDRATALAQRTGMTTTQVVEEALRAYFPPPRDPAPPPGLIWEGPVLVRPANGRRVTIEETIAAIEEARDERG